MLDIDGVILPLSSAYERVDESEFDSFLKTVQFDQECVIRINKLVEVTGAEIMLISTWRKTFQNHLPQLKAALKSAGLTRFAEPWMCPHKFTSEKVHEVSFGISAALEHYYESSELVVILIDDSGVNYEPSPHLDPISFIEIVPDGEVGFSQADLTRVLASPALQSNDWQPGNPEKSSSNVIIEALEANTLEELLIKRFTVQDHLDALKELGLISAEIHRYVISEEMLQKCDLHDLLDEAKEKQSLSIIWLVKNASKLFGSKKKALHWLKTPKKFLNGTTPFQACSDKAKFSLVKERLTSSSFGIW